MLIFKRNKKSVGIIFSILLALGVAYKTESNLSYPTNVNTQVFSPIDTAYAGDGGGDGDGAGGCGDAASGSCDGALGSDSGYYDPGPPTVQVNFN